MLPVCVWIGSGAWYGHMHLYNTVEAVGNSFIIMQFDAVHRIVAGSMHLILWCSSWTTMGMGCYNPNYKGAADGFDHYKLDK